LGLAYLVFGPIAIRILYGARFVGAIRPMLLMLPGIVTMSLYMILTRNFTSRNRQGVNIVAAGVALAVNVRLNCVLIPRSAACTPSSCGAGAPPARPSPPAFPTASPP